MTTVSIVLPPSRVKSEMSDMTSHLQVDKLHWRNFFLYSISRKVRTFQSICPGIWWKYPVCCKSVLRVDHSNIHLNNKHNNYLLVTVIGTSGVKFREQSHELISKSDERELRDRFEITSPVTA